MTREICIPTGFFYGEYEKYVCVLMEVEDGDEPIDLTFLNTDISEIPPK